MDSIQDAQVDKTYVLMNEIDDDNAITQRELASKSGLSLGSVNILLKKMIHEGFVKMESIPANRVVYMLTPAGFAEKAQKTVRYVRRHYRAIEDTKEQIFQNLSQLEKKYDRILVQRTDDELSLLVEAACKEFLHKNNSQKIVFFSKDIEVQEIVTSPASKILVIVDIDGFGFEKFTDIVYCLSFSELV